MPISRPRTAVLAAVVAAATVAPVTALGPFQPEPIRAAAAADWDLVFSEDFTGDSLDLDVWEPGWYANTGYNGPVNDNEDACYHSSQVSVGNGNLRLRAKWNPTLRNGCRAGDGTKARYVTGLVNTRKSFTFAYGHAEARIYLPGDSDGLHNWPAFWTASGFGWPSTGEIDIIEGDRSQPCSYYHSGTQKNHRVQGGCVDWDDPSGWHTFAADWEPGRTTFYYDGVEVQRITEDIGGVDHYIILDYAINTSLGVDVPSTMLVDYVRVWQPPTATERPDESQLEVRTRRSKGS